ncbi:MAG: carboxypeptidase [Caldilineaceae bacterium SB0670_bin_27]|uniref:Carboxypeptidase n=1 Tax=Caldilineaceae bacterium SB0664_bin_27 TaxID=2605260 RepID=A0A6B0YSW9_9CHLR|nr:carboxypeptidase [Caldilineaceae bacterium SB0664_bin_27]MYJ77853.1 carboxypeptidase [Caldilineaceae bacterium SB0670_bin_27]
MDFNHYFSNDEVESVLEGWAHEYPHLARVNELGKSHEKRTIPVLTLTNRETGSDEDKPAIWIDSNIHATEVAGTTVALHIAHTLLSGYGSDARCKRLLDSVAFYIVPRLNPDGAALALAENPRYVRSGTRPYPFLEPVAGLHEEDIDGDGRILQMRIPDPNGDWKISSLDDRLMQKRGPDEHGDQYYRLLPEGRVEDFDGVKITLARPLQGLDFNRNFPFEWQPESTQAGAGPFPASEEEIRAAVSFISRHNNISVAVTYHTYSGVILRPFSTRPDEEMETGDLWVYELMGERGKELTGYPCLSVYHGFRYHPKEVTNGGFDDWVYDHLGMFSFTIELWDLPGRAGIKDRDFIGWFRKHPHEDDLKILTWLEENSDDPPLVDWYPYEHAQLGRVEIGGYDRMFTWSNPPRGIVGEEAALNTSFALSLADMLPRLTVHSLSLDRLSDEGDHRLRLVVENSGFLPTYTSAQGRKRVAARPVRVELELPEGVSLSSGQAKTEMGHLEGRSGKLSVSTVFAASPTDNRAWAEWVVRGQPGAEVKIRIRSDRAGSLEDSVVLR